LVTDGRYPTRPDVRDPCAGLRLGSQHLLVHLRCDVTEVCENKHVDYDLTRLGLDEFEHLAQALCVAGLGAKVSVFGDGPDGGREATKFGDCQRRDRLVAVVGAGQ